MSSPTVNGVEEAPEPCVLWGRPLVADRVLLSVTLILLGFGLLMLWSALQSSLEGRGWVDGAATMARQLCAAAVGLGLLLACLREDYRVLRSPSVARLLLGISALLLLGALASPPVHEVSRWIRLGSISFQPSEFAKVAVVIFLASEFERRARSLWTVRDLVAPACGVGMVSLLVLLEPDFFSALHIALAAGAVAFLAGVPLRFFVIGGTTILSMAALRITSAPYRVARFLDYIGSWARPHEAGHHRSPSVSTVASGGAFGQGFMNGEQKASALPYPYSDFIFGVVGEELGFMGALIVIGLFVALLWRGLRTALRAPDLFGRLLAAGLSITIVSQAFFNISMVVGLLPTRSIPLPFFSAGGTSLICCLLSVGIVLSVSRHTD